MHVDGGEKKSDDFVYVCWPSGRRLKVVVG